MVSRIVYSTSAKHRGRCPDGNGLLAARDDHTIVLIPTHPTPNTVILPPVIKRRQSAPLVDCLWYPTATWDSEDGSFCYLTSVREHPVKLIDGTSGKVRTYLIVNFSQDHTPAYSKATYRFALLSSLASRATDTVHRSVRRTQSSITANGSSHRTACPSIRSTEGM